MTRRIAVVGGGISGLAAAYELRRLRDDVEVELHERTDRLGGKVRTTPFAGRPVDEAADAFLARVPWGIELCRELGLATELVSPAQQSAYVWWDGALRRLPAGLVLGVPTDLAAVQAAGIVDAPIAATPGAAPLGPDEDIAVGALVRAQLGDAVFERLVDPLLGGINAGDGDRLSVRAAAPQIAAAAQRDRDLVAALRAQPPPAPGPVFYAPRGGMGTIVDALAAWLASHDVSVRIESDVARVDEIDADAIVLATPAYVAAALLRRGAPDAAVGLDAIAYSSVALVTMSFPTMAVHRPLDGSGFLVPRTAGTLMSACTWTTAKWEHLATADDHVVVRVSTGRFGDERFTAMDDGTLVAALVDELATTSAISGPPDDVRVSRWPRSFPQYEPGHLDRVAAVERALAAAVPNVTLAGAALRGVGVPACIRQGRDAARRALDAAP
jgi:oxygen-dependent protoporphyrinogen oxidase